MRFNITRRKVVAGFCAASLAVLMTAWLPAQTEKSSATQPAKAAAEKAPATAPSAATEPSHTTASGLTIIDVAPGQPGVKNGDIVWVQYTGRLKATGVKFDSSFDHPGAAPFRFTVGTGSVIRGWDEGVLGMKIGEKRRLIIPANLGYGAEAHGPIPGNATLEFDIELIGIVRVPPQVP